LHYRSRVLGVEESRATKEMATKQNTKKGKVEDALTESKHTTIIPKSNMEKYLKEVRINQPETTIEPTSDRQRKATKGMFAKQKNAESEDLTNSLYKYTDWYSLHLSYNDISSPKEEILENGTLLQKLRLYFHTAELRTLYEEEDRDETLTKEEIASIMAVCKETEENITISRKCMKEYRTIKRFGSDVLRTLKTFQVAFAFLAKWLNKLSYCEQKAFECTLLVNAEQTIMDKDELRQLFTDLVSMHKDTGVAFTYDTNAQEMRLKFDKEGGIQQHIKEATKKCTQALSTFKAYATAAEEYIKNSTLQYYPILIQKSIMEAEEELFEREMVDDITFFKSYVNDRRETGETITPEEDKRAIIPDYLEIKPDREVYRNCKHGLKLIEDGKIL